MRHAAAQHGGKTGKFRRGEHISFTAEQEQELQYIRVNGSSNRNTQHISNPLSRPALDFPLSHSHYHTEGDLSLNICEALMSFQICSSLMNLPHSLHTPSFFPHVTPSLQPGSCLPFITAGSLNEKPYQGRIRGKVI